MADEPRVRALLEELLDSQASPEEVCSSCPELLGQVRERWRQVSLARAELDSLFPPFSASTKAPEFEAAPLPRIAGYEVEALLGQGGMGVVFRARQLSLNRVVALKMVLAGEYAGRNERERFQREAEAVAGLRHPNIVQIHDVSEADGRPFFTMEYVEGGSLARKLGGKPQSPRKAAALLATLASGVHAAHQGGIVHRDLKPSNVLLTSHGTPKISDFGLARRLDDDAALTRTGIALGTPSYMAPEQAAGKRFSVEPAVDIYALGAILYELLTGVPPFKADTPAETIQHVISRDPVPPSRIHAKVPRDLEIICLKCLRKEPALRYADASALEEDLECFLRGEAIKARPESRIGRLARRSLRRPLLSAALLLGTVLVTGLIGGGLWLLFERAATLRRMAAEQVVAERAADESLRGMVESMKTSSWSEARAALERARAWLGTIGSADLQSQVKQGGRDLDLAARLDATRLTGYSRVGNSLDFGKADQEFETAFREFGIGQIGEPSAVVAARVKASNIHSALLAALDYWSVCARNESRRRWLADVTEQVDGDTTGWRARARAPAIWKDEAALMKLITTAPAPEQSAALLLAIEQGASADFTIRRKFLERLHERHPGDFWVNFRLASALVENGKDAEAIGYFQTAAAIRPEAAWVQHNLGLALARSNRLGEALARVRESVRLEPTLALERDNFANILAATGRHVEAIEEAKMAIQLGSKSAVLRAVLGRSLEAVNRPLEALEYHRQAFAIEPKHPDVQRAFRAILLRLGRTDELLDVWAKVLNDDPPKHDDWYGYAELCLLCGREKQYLSARQALLKKFGAATDPYWAERTSRACLLRPAAGDDLTCAVALANRAASVDPKYYPGVYPAFRFVKCLALYRQGKFEQTISAIKSDASFALRLQPALVLAMAQQQSGLVDEARKTLAAAVLTYDWRPERVVDQDALVCHVLRREAESLISPEPRAILGGARQL